MDTLWMILMWALVGFIVGFIARLLVTGPRALGLLGTILLGIVGAIVGGLIHSAINGSASDPFSFRGGALVGWLFAILGAVVVLLVWGWWARSRRTW